jgi:hypothetical protein
MIEAHDLAKRYGSTIAVNDLSFSVRSGMVTGFLGSNGAWEARYWIEMFIASARQTFAYSVRGRLPGCAHHPSISDWQVFCRSGEQAATVW